MSVSYIALLRSLGAGGLLGGGILALIFLLFPAVFPTTATIQVVASVGGVLGAGLHHYLSAAVDWLLFRPLLKLTRVYGRLLLALPLLPFMSPEQRSRILGVSVDELALPANDKPAVVLPAPRKKSGSKSK